MTDAIAVKEECGQLSVQAVCEQVNLIQQILNAVMKKGTHYDVVPGCGDKPTLLKPGAEKLALTFRLDLQTETEVVELGGGHREYRSKTNVYHIKTGERFGSGMGSCSTMETKFRYRNENTGRSVPDQYWKTRDSNLIGGPSFTTRKVDGKWYIFQQVEYPNPADYYNTCLKMSEKRSKVAAVLNVTAASDLFTQDIEEMREIINAETEEITKPKKPEVQSPQTKQEDKKTEVHKIVTGVNEVTQKAGKNAKTGADYTRYRIVGENEEYITFDANFATLAKTAHESGLKVEIEYTVDKFGNNIFAMNLVEPDLNLESGELNV